MSMKNLRPGRYTKRPVTVSAEQITSENIEQIARWCGGWVSDGLVRIRTLEGVMEAHPGDYVIQGVAGEFYPCKKEIFEQTYMEGETMSAPVIDVKSLTKEKWFAESELSDSKDSRERWRRSARLHVEKGGHEETREVFTTYECVYPQETGENTRTVPVSAAGLPPLKDFTAEFELAYTRIQLWELEDREILPLKGFPLTVTEMGERFTFAAPINEPKSFALGEALRNLSDVMEIQKSFSHRGFLDCLRAVPLALELIICDCWEKSGLSKEDFFIDLGRRAGTRSLKELSLVVMDDDSAAYTLMKRFGQVADLVLQGEPAQEAILELATDAILWCEVKLKSFKAAR